MFLLKYEYFFLILIKIRIILQSRVEKTDLIANLMSIEIYY